MTLKYKPPQVEEEYSESDTQQGPKRKRTEDPSGSTPQALDPGFDAEGKPTKVAKGAETPIDPEEEVGDQEDEVDEEEYGDPGDDYREENNVDQDDGDEVELLADDDDDELSSDVLEGDEEEDLEEESPTDERKIQKALEKFGRVPLYGTSIAKEPLTAEPDTVLAMLIDAMLKSRPISHDLSQRTVKKIIDEGYNSVRKLEESSFEDRTNVLREGGYNRYREQGATNLKQLAELIDEKYDGDLNNILDKGHHDRDEIKALVREVKGLGDLGIDLFFNNVQGVWPEIAPFVDSRSLQTADEVGIGTDLDSIFAELEGDAMRMSKLANGLSIARLEKRQGELLSV